MEKQKEIECFIHDHPMILRDNKENNERNCCVCELPILGPIYGCDQCKEFVVHKSCAQLPQQIQHPFHSFQYSEHPLTLLHKSPYNNSGVFLCDACGKNCSGFLFHCAECGFELDLGCALLEPTISYEGHPHPLVYLDKFYQSHRNCYLCDDPCGAASVFRCVQWNYNIHKSCAEWPKQIQHAFHPLHPLTLTHLQVMEDTYCCNACNCLGDGTRFSCERCNFKLHFSCASKVPSVRYEGHEHLLTFLQRITCNYQHYEHHACNSCHTPFEIYFDDDEFLFRCVECDFNLHLHCHPSLPLTIKHECHIDPLTLTPSVVQQDNDSNEFYCDACETRRNPKHPVYYCAECDYVAHIRCIISEVLPSLIVEQESHTIKTASTGEEGALGATTGDEAMARGVSTTLPSEKVEVGDAADFDLPTLDEEIAKLEADIKAMTAKLDALKGKRAQYVASKMPSARDECLIEASTLEE